MITRNDPTFIPDVSEQRICWKTNPDMGSTNGGWGTSVLSYFTTHGVVSETECPYQSSSPDSFTYDSRLSGTGTLFKLGIGTLTMSGTNSFSGNVTVSMGMLDYNGNSTLPGGNYTVNGAAPNSGALNIGSLSHSIGSFQIAGNGGVTGTTWQQGDTNGDGVVDELDRDIWFSHVGLPQLSGALSAAAGVAAVPRAGHVCPVGGRAVGFAWFVAGRNADSGNGFPRRFRTVLWGTCGPCTRCTSGGGYTRHVPVLRFCTAGTRVADAMQANY